MENQPEQNEKKNYNFDLKKLDLDKLSIEELEAHFDEMIKARTSGEWEITFKKEKDYKNLLTILRDKVQWTGNEAINIVTAAESLKRAYELEEKHRYSDELELTLVLNAHEIESIVNMTYRYSSKGLQSAKDFLNSILPFTAVISRMRNLDQELQKVQATLDERKQKETEEKLIVENYKEELVTENIN